MLKYLLVYTLFISVSVAAQDEHQHHQMSSATNMPETATMSALPPMLNQGHKEELNWLLMADRFEYANGDGSRALQWEAQGWTGGDLHKLWFKTEGSYDTLASELDDSEVQLLYSRAILPFWDFQAGWRHDEGGAASRNYAAVGFKGLAPYWFEVDAAAFVSEQGKVSVRLDAEYDLRLTQRLILQPRMELNYAAASDVAADVWQGMNDINVGLRLRYEIEREFAPYIGIQWWKAHGRAGAELRRANMDDGDFRIVAGLSLWY